MEQDISEYIQRSKVTNYISWDLPTHYSRILYFDYEDDNDTIIMLDTENNIDCVYISTKKSSRIMDISMYPSSSTGSPVNVLKVDGMHKEYPFLYIFNKINSNTENIVLVCEHTYCIPIDWCILRSSIIDNILYIVVSHTLIGQDSQILVYYINMDDKLFSHYCSDNILRIENVIISSTIFSNIDCSKLQWWCQHTIGTLNGTIYVKDLHRLFHHHIPILHITGYDKKSHRLMFVDTSHALIEMVFTDTDLKKHYTNILTPNIQPHGFGVILLSLTTVRSSITVDGLLVVLITGGNRWKLLISFDHGQHWTISFLPSCISIHGSCDFSFTLDNQLLWKISNSKIILFSLPISTNSSCCSYRIHNSGKVSWGPEYKIIMFPSHSNNILRTTDDIYSDFMFPTVGISPNMQYIVLSVSNTIYKDKESLNSCNTLQNDIFIGSSISKNTNTNNEYDVVYIDDINTTLFDIKGITIPPGVTRDKKQASRTNTDTNKDMNTDTNKDTNTNTNMNTDTNTNTNMNTDTNTNTNMNTDTNKDMNTYTTHLNTNMNTDTTHLNTDTNTNTNMNTDTNIYVKKTNQHTVYVTLYILYIILIFVVIFCLWKSCRLSSKNISTLQSTTVKYIPEVTNILPCLHLSS
jgi:hypothetical protein